MTTHSKKPSFSWLPQELVEAILSERLLTHVALSRAARVCKAWKHVCQAKLNNIFNPHETTFFVVNDHTHSIEHYSFLRLHTPLRSFKGHRSWIHAIYTSPDRKELVSAELNTVSLWTIATGGTRVIQLASSFGAVAFTWDNQYLLTGDSAGNITLCTRADGIRRVSVAQKTGLDYILVSPGDHYMLTNSISGINIWDLASLKIKCADLTSQMAAGKGKGNLPALPMATDLRPLRHIELGFAALCVISPDNLYAVMASSSSNQLVLVDLQSGEKLWQLAMPSPTVSIAQTLPKGPYSFVTLSNGTQACEWVIGADKKSLVPRSIIFQRNGLPKTTLIANNDKLVLYHTQNTFYVHSLTHGVVWKGDATWNIGTHPLFEIC